MQTLSTLVWLAIPAGAATLHVDDGAAPGGDGSAANPIRDLQDAIDRAEDGDDILVAEGTWPRIQVVSKEVHLLGGYDDTFAVRDPSGTPSVVEGTPTRAAVTLYETASSVLDGFVVRGGDPGVFIDADFASTTNRPELRNNVIEENGTPSRIGGGIFADHCDAVFVGNTIRGNIGDRGAALAAFCATVLVEGNVVEGNVAHGDHGGGLYLAGGSIVVRGNLIRDNEVGVVIGYGWGAGALVFGEGSSATFESNVFTGNHAESVGSGAFVDDGATATFDHDLFYANDCGTQGGAALYVDGYATDVSSHVSLVNVTVADHDCPGAAVYVEAQSTVSITNGIFWGNGGDDFVTDATSSVTATFTLSEEALDGEGNLSVDPLFVDPRSGDFHVRSTSPTVDAGDPDAAFDLEPAPNGLRVNLGHTGNTAEATLGGPGGTVATTDDPPTTTSPDDDLPVGDAEPSTDGCGCASDAGPPAFGWVLSLAVAGRRRRAPPR